MWWISRVIRIAPDAPSGCPTAIAPPSGLSRVWVRAGLGQPGQRHRRECLVDLVGADVVDTQARLGEHASGSPGSARSAPAPGPTPATRAGAVAHERASGRARGARSGVVTSSAAAPSEICEELPGVDDAVVIERTASARPASRRSSRAGCPRRRSTTCRRRRPGRAGSRTRRVSIAAAASSCDRRRTRPAGAARQPPPLGDQLGTGALVEVRAVVAGPGRRGRKASPVCRRGARAGRGSCSRLHPPPRFPAGRTSPRRPRGRVPAGWTRTLG